MTQAQVGSVMAFLGSIDRLCEPTDGAWLPCDGRSLRIAEHRQLFAAIGWTYGLGQDAVGRTTFALPDLRGYFLRGASGESGRDPDANERTSQANAAIVSGNVVGSVQEDALQIHTHLDQGHSHTTNAAQGGWEWSDNTDDRRVGKPDAPAATVGEGKAKLGGPAPCEGAPAVRVAPETRPKNVAVHWIICAR